MDSICKALKYFKNGRSQSLVEKIRWGDPPATTKLVVEMHPSPFAHWSSMPPQDSISTTCTKNSWSPGPSIWPSLDSPQQGSFLLRYHSACISFKDIPRQCLWLSRCNMASPPFLRPSATFGRPSSTFGHLRPPFRRAGASLCTRCHLNDFFRITMERWLEDSAKKAGRS